MRRKTAEPMRKKEPLVVEWTKELGRKKTWRLRPRRH
jgi:hypothetical protein